MKLSIIAAIYGVEKYIEQFAESLFQQTVTKDVEFVFVNDCSLDDSIVILKQTLSKYQNLQNQVKILEHKKNKGLASARLTGLENSTGNYVWFVDSDDWLEKNAVQTLLDLLEDNVNKSPDVVYFSGIYYGGRENEIRAKVTPETILTSLTWSTLWSCIISRSFLYKNNIFPIENLNYGEDRIMTSRIACMAEKSIQIANRLYHYRTDNNNSYSNTIKPIYLLQDAMGGVIVHDFYLKKGRRNFWPALFINQAIRYFKLSKNDGRKYSKVRKELLANMFHDSILMTILYFFVGWVLPMRYRVTLLYYFRNMCYKKKAIPITNFYNR